MQQTESISERPVLKKKGKKAKPPISGYGGYICVKVQNPRIFETIRNVLRVESDLMYSDDSRACVLVWFDTLCQADRVFPQVLSYQVANRIPNMNVLCRKAPLAYLMERMRPLFPAEFEFAPCSYILPFQSPEFTRMMRKNPDRKMIVKPDGGSLGHGIRIVDGRGLYIPDDDMAVAQELVPTVTLEGKKFDLRIYLLVASVEPLRVYIFQEGLARFCLKTIDDPSIYGQITNVAINHDSRLMSETLERMGLSSEERERLYADIDEALLLTLFAGMPYLIEGLSRCDNSKNFTRCFHILGFDVLLGRRTPESEIKPYVLEVNYRPSLDTHWPMERQMKEEVVRDAMRIGCPCQDFQAILTDCHMRSEASIRRLFDACDLTRFVDASRELAVKRSRYRQLWPPTGPRAGRWQEVLDAALSRPLEPIPGFVVEK